MEQLQRFSHDHLLSLFHFPHHNNKDFDKEEEGEEEWEAKEENHYDKDDSVDDVGKCNMCNEEIYPFNRCYYSCMECDYSLHKFCAQLPMSQQNHPLHLGHILTLSRGYQLQDSLLRYSFDSQWACDICKITRKRFYNYHCSICHFSMDIICATTSEQKMDHPSHPHQLLRCFSQMTCPCNACGNKHSGTFFYCTTCSWFRIHLDCALLPNKLLIQRSTNDSFSHPHLLTLVYSFPRMEKRAKYYPNCRICNNGFNSYEWHYRCNKCWYYIHVECVTSRREAFMSILSHPGLGKTYKNFKDDDHPNLIKCPFPDESFNLVKNLFVNRGSTIPKKQINGEMFNHQDPLILFDTQALLLNKSVSLHDPMRKVELVCDGCVRPVTDLPFYKCSQGCCGFVLHEWCTRLPSEIQNHHDHPEHTLVLLTQVPNNSLGIFFCEICQVYSNGFAYGCIECEYYVDINCSFIPDVITHDAHPNHLLRRVSFERSSDIPERFCMACEFSLEEWLGFHCPTCDFYVHTRCALLLPRMIRHKYDKHPLLLRYYPAENHESEYFCEICEDELDPSYWFYHCNTCALSMHSACAPLILQCEQSTSSEHRDPYPIFKFINVKFGGSHEIPDHPHLITFVQGINADGKCTICNKKLQYNMIFKCFECSFVCHISCVGVLSSDVSTDSDALSSDVSTDSDA